MPKRNIQPDIFTKNLMEKTFGDAGNAKSFIFRQCSRVLCVFMHCVYCARLRGCVQLGSRRLRRSRNCIHLRASSTLEISRFAHSSRLGNSIALSLICILYSLHLFPSHTHMNTQTTHTHAHIYQRYTHPHNHKRHTHTHTHTHTHYSHSLWCRWGAPY